MILTHFGLRRVHVDVLRHQRSLLFSLVPDYVCLYYWPMATTDLREKSFDAVTITDTYISKAYRKVYGCKNIYFYPDEALKLQNEVLSISQQYDQIWGVSALPPENFDRPLTFRINTFAVFSQIFARKAVLKNLMDLHPNDGQPVIMSRPDVVPDRAVDLIALASKMNSDSLILPHNGCHYGGMNDQFWLFDSALIPSVIRGLEIACSKIMAGNTLMFEKILHDSFIEAEIILKYCNFKSLIFRNGRLKDSGPCDVKEPNVFI
jgi:hypothetical protein